MTFNYILQRLIFAVVVIFAVTFVSFVLVYLAGDPVRALAGIDTTPAHLERIRERYGLHLPLHEQYFYFVTNALQGDLGRSFRYNTDVLPLVMSRFSLTLQLAALSLLLSLLIALPLGIVAAIKRHTWVDHLASFISLVGVSIPSFWLGILLILIFADHFRLLPPSGADDGLRSLIMPAVALSGYNIGLMTRLIRRSFLEEMKKQYVTVAHAKGLPVLQVQGHHILRNALIPTVTVAGLQFGVMLGGSIVVETVFALPGLGFLIIQAIRTNDLPIVRAAVLVIGISFVLINFFVDFLYSVLDPRVRYI
jgi:ABC-type dipeptide/oligopeptide/nickel transport system permease component